MQEGEYTRLVRADIEFLLRAWPNHYPGLEVLVRYDLAGGSAHDLDSTECLFARARRFAPDDINVLLVQAYYYWKSGETEEALRSYESALQIDVRSTDANYLIGLLYFEMGRYAEADRHAQIAYDQGYPLPGLMNKLKQAGQWRASVEPPPNDHSD